MNFENRVSFNLHNYNSHYTTNDTRAHRNNDTLELNDSNHFCTSTAHERCCKLDSDRLESTERTNDRSSENGNQPSLAICENYKPSYTSKTDQINAIHEEIKKLRMSKNILKETMKKLDEFLDDDSETPRVECNGCIHTPLRVSSLSYQLPRRDLRTPQYINDLNKQKNKSDEEKEKEEKEKKRPQKSKESMAVFEPFNRSTFTDKTILENRKKLFPKKKPYKKSDSERTLHKDFCLSGYRIQSATRNNECQSPSTISCKFTAKPRITSAK